jgi:CcmD family protein
MKNRFLKHIIAACLVFCNSLLNAQTNSEILETFYSEGKIWVVIAVFSIIVIGIGIYLFSIDKKITRIENELKDKKNS